MSSIFFYIAIVFGFYFIYKAIKSLDKINRLKNEGIKKRAKVIKIREEENSNDGEENTYIINHSEVNYYHTVRFNDKNGSEIEKELEFPTTKNPNKNPPFDVDIIYSIDENKNIDIILENNKGRNFTFYFVLSIGIIFLITAAYNYDGQIDLILKFINNLFK
ncbi:hypothetical protein [Polaribacter vadi]|uniref:hypothetical protein n=1 Tax=Polaribacter vadi TaxID=1774273 RepID=UPI0030EDD647|tara:strand:- start:823 stop:1308 length:486 start_codon:yes stop_codon:yes gene_type:complete